MSNDGNDIWPDAIDEPQVASLSLSGGVSAKLIFYLQLYAETNDETYLAEAKLAADYLLANAPSKQDSLQGVFWAFSPYGNVCGSAYALLETNKVTADEKYRKGAEDIIDVILHFAQNKNDTISWDLGNDVLGGLAGTGLFMLYAGKELNREDLTNFAEAAGRTLISRASKEVGLNWKRGQNGRFVLPNFSHGAAGIGFFLARLYEVTNKPKFLEAALAANTYLESVAKTDEGVFLVPYGFPDPGWSRAYDIGWAHGPAGVARFYRQLHKITGEEKWLRREQACVEGILSSGIPDKPTADFGEAEFYLDNRFGVGSVASFLLDIRNRNEQQEALLQSLLAHMFDKSSYSEDGLHWPQTRYGFMQNAGDTTAFTGYFYGASGYGMILLKAQAKANGTEFIRFVDDPY